MIRENLVAERIAVEHYRELIRYFRDDDPTTRVMLEGILGVEEEHANDMHDLLVAHEGKPMLQTGLTDFLNRTNATFVTNLTSVADV